MEEIKTKVCSKCREEKPLTVEFWSRYLDKGKYTYWSSICRKCRLKMCAQWVKKNEQKRRDYNRDYNKKYYQKNKERHSFLVKKRIHSLSDGYIRDTLRHCGMMSHDVTPTMIEIKRQQLILHRLLQQFNKEEAA